MCAVCGEYSWHGGCQVIIRIVWAWPIVCSMFGECSWHVNDHFCRLKKYVHAILLYIVELNSVLKMHELFDAA